MQVNVCGLQVTVEDADELTLVIERFGNDTSEAEEEALADLAAEATKDLAKPQRKRRKRRAAAVRGGPRRNSQAAIVRAIVEDFRGPFNVAGIALRNPSLDSGMISRIVSYMKKQGLVKQITSREGKNFPTYIYVREPAQAASYDVPESVAAVGG